MTSYRRHLNPDDKLTATGYCVRLTKRQLAGVVRLASREGAGRATIIRRLLTEALDSRKAGNAA